MPRISTLTIKQVNLIYWVALSGMIATNPGTRIRSRRWPGAAGARACLRFRPSIRKHAPWMEVGRRGLSPQATRRNSLPIQLFLSIREEGNPSSALLGTPLEFWLNGQRNWDLWHAMGSPSARITRRIRPLTAV